MPRLAILAGQGALPQAIAAAHPEALFVRFDGVAVDRPGNQCFDTSYERFGEMFDGLREAGVDAVVFAGGLTRPSLNPANFDAKMTQLAPRFMAAMQSGDDGLLRAVVLTFEEEGFAVCGAHEVLPDLTVSEGVLGGVLSPEMQQDAAHGTDILTALGPLDVAQGCVVANGLCLGIETAQGTQAMLRFVAETRGALRTAASGGVLVKRPKSGQDLRIDMPAIGPDTIDQAQAAGLAGICIAAGAVLVLEPGLLQTRIAETGVAVWATA